MLWYSIHIFSSCTSEFWKFVFFLCWATPNSLTFSRSKWQFHTFWSPSPTWCFKTDTMLCMIGLIINQKLYSTNCTVAAPCLMYCTVWYTVFSKLFSFQLENAKTKAFKTAEKAPTSSACYTLTLYRTRHIVFNSTIFEVSFMRTVQ